MYKKVFLLVTILTYFVNVIETQEVCGKRDFSKAISLIGNQSSNNNWPWLAALFITKPSGLEFTCSATLISRNLVITAAQCVYTSQHVKLSESRLIVYLGRHNLLSWGELDDSQARTVSKIIEHPSITDSDLAVLVLNKPAEFTWKVQPICLLDERETQTMPGVSGVVIGWSLDPVSGFPTEPMTVTVPSMSQKECKNSDKQNGKILNEKIFCVDIKNACQEGNGEGLYILNGSSESWKLRGVVFKPLENKLQCSNTQYRLFTDMSKFTPWLREQILQNTATDGSSLAELDAKAESRLGNLSFECNVDYHRMKSRYEDKLATLNNHTSHKSSDEEIDVLAAELKDQAKQISEMAPKIEKMIEAHTEKVLRCVGTVIKLELEYLNQRYYFFSDNVTNRNWEAARTFCVSEGMDLASIESEEEYTVMEKAVKRLFGNRGEKGRSGIWVGGSDAAVEGRWKWVATGNPIVFNRNAGSCMQNNKKENCLCISPSRWCDCDCAWVGPFICKMYKPC